MTKEAEISELMTLGRATVDKFEAIEDNDERVEAGVNLTDPRMAEMLLRYGNTVRVQTVKQTMRLDCIVTFNALGALNNCAVV